MSLRQLARCCPLLVARKTAGAAVEGQAQACGKQQPVFQQLLAGMRGQAHAARHYSQQQQQQHLQQQVFQPSRLYPKQQGGSEAAVFWGLVGVNAGVAFLAKAEAPEVKAALAQHCRASVASLADGRWHTLLTSSVCHTSVLHCGINLLLLALYRRTQPLRAREVRGRGGGSLQCCWQCCGVGAVMRVNDAQR
jgi:hypothetical protein